MTSYITQCVFIIVYITHISLLVLCKHCSLLKFYFFYSPFIICYFYLCYAHISYFKVVFTCYSTCLHVTAKKKMLFSKTRLLNVFCLFFLSATFLKCFHCNFLSFYVINIGVNGTELTQKPVETKLQ
jgi:hypothetical protein